MNHSNPFCPTFETTDCPKCQATGKRTTVSGTQINCFVCGGTTQVLTKRGEAARNYMRCRLLAPAATVKPGDLVWFYTDLFTETARVTKIERHGYIVRIHAERAGTRQPMIMRQLATDPVQWGYTAHELMKIRDQTEAYQASLTKAGAPRKHVAKLVKLVKLAA